MNKIKNLLKKLNKARSLTLLEYEQLILGYSSQVADYAAALAVENRKAVYGTDIYIRGLIEISNICKNDCYYCGIRCSNKNCDRYRLSKEDI